MFFSSACSTEEPVAYDRSFPACELTSFYFLWWSGRVLLYHLLEASSAQCYIYICGSMGRTRPRGDNGTISPVIAYGACHGHVGLQKW